MASGKSVEPAGFELSATYVQLHDGAAATPVPVDADFWCRIEARTELHQGRLLTAFDVMPGNSHWEMHPDGDEVLYLASGAMTIVLEDANGISKTALAPGKACIVPRGVWHSLITHTAGTLLAITRGKGTQVRA